MLTAERTADKAKVEISRWDTIEEVNTFSEHSLAFEAGYMAVPAKWPLVGVLLDQAKLGNPLIETEESQWYDDKDGSDTDSD